jgi:hypothetical protein
VAIGETPNTKPQEVDLVHEFGEMTTNPNISRRRAVSMLARKHGLAPNSVYEALEDAKKSIK